MFGKTQNFTHSVVELDMEHGGVRLADWLTNTIEWPTG